MRAAIQATEERRLSDGNGSDTGYLKTAPSMIREKLVQFVFQIEILQWVAPADVLHYVAQGGDIIGILSLLCP